MKKEIRCKKCNKLLTIIDNGNIKIQGKTSVEISKNKYIFRCVTCKTIITGSIK